MADTLSLEQRLKTQGRALGLDGVRIADVTEPWQAQAQLRRFVALERHGDMEWMATTLERRAHPKALWPEARSAIVAALNYGPATDPLRQLAHTSHGAVSVYAQGADYHDVLKRKLKQLARQLAQQTGAAVKVFVDTAPLMEKPLAQRAGLGWAGKHTNLVSRDFGSWLFLGVILTDAALAPDMAETDHCGACRRCLAVCPTDAFPAPYELDARRCLAYLAIEHKGPIPRALRAAMGNRVYGCDDCLAVCPWNKFAAIAREAALHPRPQTALPPLQDLAALDDEGFRAVFAGSPIKRTGRDRFVRNVAVAIGNSGAPALVATAQRLSEDAAPLVRGAGVWALWRLASPDAFAAAWTQREPQETNAYVRSEWAACQAVAAGRPAPPLTPLAVG